MESFGNRMGGADAGSVMRRLKAIRQELKIRQAVGLTLCAADSRLD
jgi:hypothetical protein